MTATRSPAPERTRHNGDLRVPDIGEDDDTLTAALSYAAAGWFVGPVRAASKHPGSVLGKGWETKTSRDPDTIVSWFAGADHGVFLHCGRSGAVVLDVDDPAAVPEVARRALTDTPPPYQSTRSDSPRRGHYLYAAPAGRRFGNGTGKLGREWGEVRGANGVVVVAPSQHEKASSGGRYRWERTGPVPELPAAIAAALPDSTDTASAAASSEVEAFLEQHAATGHVGVLRAVFKGLDQQLARGGSRHDAARDALCQAMREAQAGCYPARDAAEGIRSRFAQSVTGEHRDPAEWGGMLSWAVAQAKLDDPAERRRRVEKRAGAPEPPPAEYDVDGSAPSAATAPGSAQVALPNLPAEFWQRRTFLQHIHQAALARRVSPDYVLHAVMARTSSLLDHRSRVDTGVDRTNLSYFTIPVGPSGAGKSRGNRAAQGLIPLDQIAVPHGYRDSIALGSGEGLAEAYMGTELRDTDQMLKSGPNKGEYKKEKVRTQVRHNVLFVVDEGEALMKTQERNGTTIGATLRSAWRGETIGQANGREETTRLIPQDSYALGLIVGFQPRTVQPLLADLDAGTPQRFSYCHASYPDAPRRRPPDPGPLDLSRIALSVESPWLAESHVIPVTDPAVLDAIDEQAWETARGIVPDPIKTQRLLLVAKSAALLTVLDGRREITADDWQLAETVVSASDAVVDALLNIGRVDAQRRNQERDDHHVALATRVEAAKQGVQPNVERLARWVARKVHERGAAFGRSELHKLMHSRDRRLGLYDNALEYAAAHDWVQVSDVKVVPGGAKPA